jgi:hypothetical protein
LVKENTYLIYELGFFRLEFVNNASFVEFLEKPLEGLKGGGRDDSVLYGVGFDGGVEEANNVFRQCWGRISYNTQLQSPILYIGLTVAFQGERSQ